MVKIVVLPVLVVLLAMHTQINAFGVVRVDVVKDNSFANAIGSIISSKLAILNSFLSVKYPTSSSSSSSVVVPASTTTTSTVNWAPIYTKVIRVNSGVAAVAPVSTQVATRIDADEDNEVVPATPVVQSTNVVVNKSVIGVPAVAVSTTSGTSAVSTSVAVPSSVGYSYRKSIG